jgi:hypothetical protein
MWAKNLLFLIVCAAALAAFKSSLFPPAESRPDRVPRNDDISPRATVARVDAAFAELWRGQNLQPAAAASDLAIARRLSLALTGTIPSLEEIRHFEKLSPDERLEAWLAERLVDRRSADYMAERLARALVGVENGPFLVYRRRRFVSWLADQLAANEPYDQIVQHLIADSGLWTDTPATNFITVATRGDDDNQPDANQLAARVSRSLLGVRLDCAECHDHPFEAWKQRDFQSLAAFFGGTRQGLRGIRDVESDYQVEDRRTGETETIRCDVPFARELLPGKGAPRRRLAAWITHRENRAFAREAVNRAWALLFGRPLVAPVDNLPPGSSLPAALDILADDFAAHGYNWQRLLRTLASTKAFRLDSKLEGESDDPQSTQQHDASWAVFPLTRLRPEQVVGAILQSASLATIDYQSHIVVRLVRAIRSRDFVDRYGDGGTEEFEARGGTIPQRLLMMNGEIVREKTKDSLLANAATQIAVLAPNDRQAVETAVLAVLTRRPDGEEMTYLAARLAGKGTPHIARLGDLYWALLNSTEFSWNH